MDIRVTFTSFSKIIVRNELAVFFKAFQLSLSCRLFKSLKPTLPSTKTFHVNCYKYHSIYII